MMATISRPLLTTVLLLSLFVPAAWAGKGVVAGEGGTEPIVRVVRAVQPFPFQGYGTVVSRVPRELLFLRNGELIVRQERGESFLLQRDAASEAQLAQLMAALAANGAGARNETCRYTYADSRLDEVRLTWYGPRRSTQRTLLVDRSLPFCSNQTLNLVVATEKIATDVLADARPPVASGFFARSQGGLREVTGQILCGNFVPTAGKVGLYAEPAFSCQFESCTFRNVSPLAELATGSDGRFTLPVPNNAPSPLYVLVAATPETVQTCGGPGSSFLQFVLPAEPAGDFEVYLDGFFR
jgi:hypothetical protein